VVAYGTLPWQLIDLWLFADVAIADFTLCFGVLKRTATSPVDVCINSGIMHVSKKKVG